MKPVSTPWDMTGANPMPNGSSTPLVAKANAERRATEQVIVTLVENQDALREDARTQGKKLPYKPWKAKANTGGRWYNYGKGNGANPAQGDEQWQQDWHGDYYSTRIPVDSRESTGRFPVDSRESTRILVK